MTDKETLELCIETVLNSPEDIVGRHKQIKAKLDDDGWEDTARLCSYSLQRKNLDLPPWVPTPSHGDTEGNDQPVIDEVERTARRSTRPEAGGRPGMVKRVSRGVRRRPEIPEAAKLFAEALKLRDHREDGHRQRRGLPRSRGGPVRVPVWYPGG